jgi:hypothetical protein
MAMIAKFLYILQVLAGIIQHIDRNDAMAILRRTILRHTFSIKANSHIMNVR